MAALIFAKTASDKCLILDTRQSLIYPFTSPGWTDLRLGVWMSLTSATNSNFDAAPETMTYSGVGDKVAIGFRDNGTAPIGTAGTVFAGYFPTNVTAGSSYPVLNNTPPPGNGWWNNTPTSVVNGTIGSSFNFGTLLEFPSNANATGYCSLTVVKLTRPTATSLSFTCRASTGPFAGYGNYSSNPTVASTRTMVRTYPDVPSQQSPYTSGYGTAVSNATLASAPAALYFHWPFYNSRLRIHTIVLEKYA